MASSVGERRGIATYGPRRFLSVGAEVGIGAESGRKYGFLELSFSLSYLYVPTSVGHNLGRLSISPRTPPQLPATSRCLTRGVGLKAQITHREDMSNPPPSDLLSVYKVDIIHQEEASNALPLLLIPQKLPLTASYHQHSPR